MGTPLCSGSSERVVRDAQFAGAQQRLDHTFTFHTETRADTQTNKSYYG
jgi:hypothetical protein